VCVSLSLPPYLSCCSHFGAGISLFHFILLILRVLVGPLGRGISPSLGHYLHRTTQTHNKCIQTSMPLVGFELTIPVSKRPKTVHDLDLSATVIVNVCLTRRNSALGITRLSEYFPDSGQVWRQEKKWGSGFVSGPAHNARFTLSVQRSVRSKLKRKRKFTYFGFSCLQEVRISLQTSWKKRLSPSPWLLGDFLEALRRSHYAIMLVSFIHFI
jgi:hypothetical protein